MTPVVIDVRRALIRGTCEHHNCPHQLATIFNLSPASVIAMHTDRDERNHPIGRPFPSELKALTQGGGWSVGDVFGKPSGLRGRDVGAARRVSPA